MSPPTLPARVLLADVAAAAGVSLSAASLALNGQRGVGETTRARIIAAAAALGYVPDNRGTALRTGRTATVGLLIRNLRNPFFLDIISGFDQTCTDAGLGAVVASADYSAEREAELLTALIHRNIDGLAMAPIGGSSAPAHWVRATSKPLVLINAASETLPPGVVRAHADGPRGVQLAVGHLRGLGHRRIGFLTAPPAVSPDPERLAIYHSEITGAGLSPLPIESPLRLDAATVALAAALARPAPGHISAVITNSDYLALAVYRATEQCGLRIPADVSVVGHDDLPTSAFLRPPLTTVAVNSTAMGAAIAGQLLTLLAGGDPPPDHCAPVELVVRESTAPPPPERT